MEFNIADLFECVADAVPEREAVVCNDAAPHLRGARRTRRPGSRTRCATPESRSATTSASTCATRSRTWRRCSPATSRAPFRSTSTTATSPTSCATCATTPTSSRSFHDADTAIARRRGSLAPALGTSSVVAGSPTPYEAPRGVGIGGTRSRPALRRRPLRALHRRDDRPAEGRGVAPGRHVLRRRSAAGTPAGRRSPRPSRSRRRCSTIPRNACARSSRRATPSEQFVSLALGPLMHASGQWSALGHAARWRQGRAVRRAPRGHGSRARSHRARARRTRATSSATRARVRCSTRSRPNPIAGTLVAAAARIGRQHPVGRGEGRPDGRAPVGAGDRRRHRLVGVSRAGRRV